MKPVKPIKPVSKNGRRKKRPGSRRLKHTPIKASPKRSPAILPEEYHPHVFLDVHVKGKYCGRLSFELFATKLPRTCENFRALCTGELGSNASGTRLHYKGSSIHSVFPGMIFQGGNISLKAAERKTTEEADVDIAELQGSSIYGRSFEDEGFFYPHTKRGLLVMANM